MTDQELQPKQLHALLDILSHHAVYAEIEDFRFPAALDHYGPPFEAIPKTPSQTPALQALVSKFLLHIPGLRDIADAFWKERIAIIIKDLEKAELSESYDKGHIGIRKTLATAISALVEYPVRGVFAGFDEPTEEDRARQYDISKSDDIQRAFRDLMHQIVYGHIIDDLVKKVGETDKVSEHTQLVQAAHEYVIVNLASFMHYTLIISPKGQNLLTLIEHANKLVPYGVMKQTLRIGNVASMINAMMKVVLAKMSMGSVTNWIGWTSGADEGMNLVQHVIAQVLQWDIRDLKSRATKIEKDKAIKKDQLEAIRSYLSKTRSEHDKLREKSRSTAKSIVMVILEDSSASSSLTEDAHKLAQDYLAIQLAIRDRDQIIKVLCRSTPDHLTQSIRDLAAAYDPLIRQTHNAVDLSATLTDFEVFLRDLIKLSKLSDARGRTTQKAQDPPTVGDFVQLLKKHQGSSHRFLHQVVKNGPEITTWFRDYALQAASHFRRSDTSGSNPSSAPATNTDTRNAGDLTTDLQYLYRSLPAQKQVSYRDILDHHAKYLATLHTASARRLRNVLTSPPSKHPIFTTKSGSAATSVSQPASRASSPAPGEPVSSTAGLDADPGPGAFLARWQALIDDSEITPGFEGRGIRTGGKGSVLKASRVGPDSQTGGGEVGGGDGGAYDGGANDGGADDGGANSIATNSTGGTSQNEPKHNTEYDDSDDEDIFTEAYEKLDQLGLEEGEKMRPPDVGPLVGELLAGFREVLGRRGCDW